MSSTKERNADFSASEQLLADAFDAVLAEHGQARLCACLFGYLQGVQILQRLAAAERAGASLQ